MLGGFTESDDVPGLPSGHWALPWTATGDSVLATDPLHGNQRTLAVHEVAGPDGLARFAAAEVSNGVYLVAVPTPAAADLGRLPGDWTPIGVWASAAEITAELRRELPTGHLLAGRAVLPVAVRRHLKDVVLWLPDDGQWALVHLTGQPETDPRFPGTTLAAGWDEVVAALG